MGYFFSTKMQIGEIEKTVLEVARFNLTLFSLKAKALTKVEN
jgi:hypothetical protein